MNNTGTNTQPQDLQAIANKYRTQFNYTPPTTSTNVSKQSDPLLASLITPPKTVTPTTNTSGVDVNAAGAQTKNVVGAAKAFTGGAATGLGATLPLTGIDYAGRHLIEALPDNFSVAGVTKQQMLENLDKSKPLTEQFANTEGKQEHPTAFSAGEAAGTTGGLIEGGAQTKLGMQGIKKAGDIIEGGVNAVKPVVEAGTNAVKQAAGKVTEAVTPKAPDLYSQALKHVTPEYNPEMVGKKITQNVIDNAGKITPTEMSRVNEGGTITGRTVNATSKEQAAAKELSNIPGYSENMSHMQVHDELIQPEIKRTAQELDQSLQNENQVIPKRQIVNVVKTAVNKVPDTSLILQKTDPAIKNYLRVVTNAANQNDGTLKGALDVRKAMDSAYENVRKGQAYDPKTINALDEVHNAGRSALNDFMIERANNTDVKGLLTKQHNLYNAAQNILPKAQTEAGSTLEKIQQFAKNHPYLAGGVGSLSLDKLVKHFTGFGL